MFLNAIILNYLASALFSTFSPSKFPVVMTYFSVPFLMKYTSYNKMYQPTSLGHNFRILFSRIFMVSSTWIYGGFMWSVKLGNYYLFCDQCLLCIYSGLSHKQEDALEVFTGSSQLVSKCHSIWPDFYPHAVFHAKLNRLLHTPHL